MPDIDVGSVFWDNPTKVHLVNQIATLSSEIADLDRYITTHPMTLQTTMAYRMRDVKMKSREELRKELAKLPDIYL